MDAYLKFQGYDEKAANKDFEEKAMKVNRHELPETQEELIISQTGGKDTSGNYKNDLVGGFGEQEIKKRAEVAKPKKKIKL
jgi:hypothetical protein